MLKNKPLNYQVPILEKVYPQNKFALWMGYGTGKSYIILNWINHNHKKCPKVLIVCKRVNLIESGSWLEQVPQHTNFSYLVIEGTKQQRVKLLKLHADIHFITYDSLDGMFEYIKAKQYDLIVFDECSKIKNAKTIRAKRARKLCFNIPHVIIADGFPVSEHLDEIWSSYNLVDTKNVLTDNYWKFMTKYFYKWRFGWQIKKGASEKIIGAISYNSVFVKLRDCIDLPPRMYRYITLEPTKEQAKYIEQLKTEFALSIPEVPDFQELEFKHILPVIVKQQQICSGFLYTDSKKTIQFQTPKLKCLYEVVTSISDKMIIWCQYTEEVNQIHKLLAPQHALKISSSQTNAEMADNLALFKCNNQYRILVTTYTLLESGETLTMANYNIRYGHIWSNKTTENAMHRTYRKGAEIHDKIIYIYIYIKDSVEEIILKTLKTKKSVQKKLMNYMEEWVN